MKKKRLLLIGLDGADWRIIKPLLKEKKLPNLQKLISSGIKGNLKSTLPSWTIPAWETLSTGLTPRELKLPTFLVRKDYKFEPYLFNYQQPKRFFDLLSDQGLKVIVANLPNIYSAYKINGRMIAGWFSSSARKLCYPDNLVKDLEDKIGRKYLIDVVGEKQEREQRIAPAPEDNNQYLVQLIELVKLRTKFFQQLLRSDWDFAFLVYVALDRIKHRTWDKKLISKLYSQVDQSLARLISLVGKETNIIIVSDHGFGKVDKVFNINDWLIKNNYLFLQKKESSRQIKKPLKSIKDFLKAENRLFYNFLKKLLAFFPWLEKEIRNRVNSRKITEVKINWQKTKAWAVGSWGGVYLNLKKRDPQGVVLKTDYKSFVKKLIKKLKKTCPRAVIKTGFGCQTQAPDLFIVPTDQGIQSLSTNIGNKEVFSSVEGGQHRQQGIFLAAGPDFKKEEEFKQLKIKQIAEIVLQLFN